MANRTAVPAPPEMPGPSALDRLRTVPRRTIVIAVVAVLAVVAGVVVVVASNHSDHTPGHYAALAGVGSDDAAALMSALAAEAPDLGPVDPGRPGQVTTKDPNVDPACTLDRPLGDAAAVTALATAQSTARTSQSEPCVDFAWSGLDRSGDPALADAGLSWVPYARDAVTFAEPVDSPNPRSLTSAQLRSAFTCADPRFQPLLPAYGSSVRAQFLTGIGVTDAADFAAAHSCIREFPSGHGSGALLRDPRQIAPVSVADYIGQTSGVERDVHGSTVLGVLDGRSATIANPASTIGIAVRTDSTDGRALTAAQLEKLYTCSAGAAIQDRYRPLLPGVGSRVRAQFLTAIGLADNPGFTTTHPCVTQNDSKGVPLPENTGTVLDQPSALVPYATAAYLAQVDGTAPDVHGTATVTPLGGGAARALDPAFPLVHDVYVVVPTAKLTTAPTSTAFVGPGSTVCSHAATITRYGYAVATDCGATTLHTPR